MKRLITAAALLAGGMLSTLDAQVYINVPPAQYESSASFQIEKAGADKGVALPVVSLNSLTDYSPIAQVPKAGLLVYNDRITETLEQGYYYWAVTPSPHWESIGGINNRFTIIQNVDPGILGYAPAGTGSNAPASFPIGNTTATKTQCLKWEQNVGGNGHTYCGYKTSDASGQSFASAYEAIKNIGGYMVTITAGREWNFVRNNILNNTANPLNDPIWIGYTSVKTPGNPERYRWITNETWRSNWDNNASVQSFFAPNNPAPAGNGRCNLIAGSAFDANRLWYTADCYFTDFSGVNINHLIVEFNQ
ncbi:C-type lectin domain-containing protein [uncultured Chryseobacterium sp.]|uniref:C-type lectin domain-containing protein n=1 Tax=uncultured Chryseobacterium sp. TaxID=259322 RepID=UPI0025F0D29D|nr:C-type lectin domain-containing protein [uncultured Chryseobacterium sp.]